MPCPRITGLRLLAVAGALLPLASQALDLRESFQAAMNQDADLLAARAAAGRRGLARQGRRGRRQEPNEREWPP